MAVGRGAGWLKQHLGRIVVASGLLIMLGLAAAILIDSTERWALDEPSVVGSLRRAAARRITAASLGKIPTTSVSRPISFVDALKRVR